MKIDNRQRKDGPSEEFDAAKPQAEQHKALFTLGTKDPRWGSEGSIVILADLLHAVLTWSSQGAAHLHGSGLLAPLRRMATAIALAC